MSETASTEPQAPKPQSIETASAATQAPQPAGPQMGDKVQVKYVDTGSPATREACDRSGRKFHPVHWIYADVLGALADNALRVRVNHRGNALHGQEVPVAAGDYRTAADVNEALRVAQSEAQFRPSAESKRQAKSLQVQLDRLMKKPAKPAPKGKPAPAATAE